jgi:ornithine--oxo-acid transaminase
MFAYLHENIEPDVLIVGKALSGGFYPVSAVLASREILGVLHPGDHGSTFGGNPLACAIARAALKVIVEEGLAERSAELGVDFLERLRAIRSPQVRSVRGRGLWVAMELEMAARPVCEALMREGLLCKETHHNVIRLAPPLTIDRSDLMWAADRIEDVLGRF